MQLDSALAWPEFGLSHNVLRSNALLFSLRHLTKKLQGYYAGNPKTDDTFDTAGKIQFYHGMGLVSDELYEVIHRVTLYLCSAFEL